jgi:hypothetical protein
LRNEEIRKEKITEKAKIHLIHHAWRRVAFKEKAGGKPLSPENCHPAFLI